MIDENYNPWLIEINMSPSMDYSTPVTKRLVKAVLKDTAKVISSNKKNRDTGGFECIYRSNEDLNKFDIYKFWLLLFIDQLYHLLIAVSWKPRMDWIAQAQKLSPLTQN